MTTSPSERTPTVEVPHDLRDVVTTTFTSSCPWGCTVRTVDGQEQPHICVGEQVIAAVAPELAFARVQHIAGRLKPLLRELLGDSWVDGVRSGRRGPCYGVPEDDAIPDAEQTDPVADSERPPYLAELVHVFPSWDSHGWAPGHIADVRCLCGPGLTVVADGRIRVDHRRAGA